MNQSEYLADDLNDDPVSPERQKEIEELMKQPPQLTTRALVLTSIVKNEEFEKIQENMKILRELYDRGGNQ